MRTIISNNLSKRVMVESIASKVKNANPQRVRAAVNYAVRTRCYDSVLDIYWFHLKHQDKAAFCLQVLGGMRIEN